MHAQAGCCRRSVSLACLVVLSLLLCQGCDGVRRDEDDGGVDDQAAEEATEAPEQQATKSVSEPAAETEAIGSDAEESGEPADGEEAASGEGKPPPEEDSLPPYFVEGSIGCFLAMFVVTFLMGRSSNEKVRFYTLQQGQGQPLNASRAVGDKCVLIG